MKYCITRVLSRRITKINILWPTSLIYGQYMQGGGDKSCLENGEIISQAFKRVKNRIVDNNNFCNYCAETNNETNNIK